jgi:hypothetical protein
MVAVELDRHPLSEDEWLSGRKPLPSLGPQEYEADETLPAASHDFGRRLLGPVDAYAISTATTTRKNLIGTALHIACFLSRRHRRQCP